MGSAHAATFCGHQRLQPLDKGVRVPWAYRFGMRECRRYSFEFGLLIVIGQAQCFLFRMCQSQARLLPPSTAITVPVTYRQVHTATTTSATSCAVPGRLRGIRKMILACSCDESSGWI